jgi:hypothetical protein
VLTVAVGSASDFITGETRPVANRQRDPKKEAFWRRKLQLWRDSDLSVRAFCQQHELSEPSFYSWRTLIAQRDRLDAQRPDPVPADTSAEPSVPLFLPIRLAAARAPLEVLLADGTLLRVPADFDADVLQRSLAVLRGASC